MDFDLNVLIQETITNLKTNEFFQGGFIIALIGVIGAYFRAIPGRIREFALRYGFIYAVVENSDPLFYWLTNFMGEYDKNKKKTILKLTTIENRGVAQDDGGETHSNIGVTDGLEKKIVPKIFSSPGYGSHIFKYRGAMILIGRHKEEAKGLASLMNPETLTLRLARWRRKEFEALIDEVSQLQADSTEGLTVIYESNYSTWRESDRKPVRQMESIIIKEEEFEAIKKVINKFLERKARYSSLGIPYNLTIKLEGPPGTGKTSLIAVIAGYLGYNVCNVNMGSVESDSCLRELYRNVPLDSILSIEDIDTYFKKRESAASIHHEGVSFNGFINTLDGLGSKNGIITVITTNHDEMLDDALLRTGRIDADFTIGFFKEKESLRMFEKFYPKYNLEKETFQKKLKEWGKDIRPSDLQWHFLKYLDTPYEAALQVCKSLQFLEDKQKVREAKRKGLKNEKTDKSTEQVGPHNKESVLALQGAQLQGDGIIVDQGEVSMV